MKKSRVISLLVVALALSVVFAHVSEVDAAADRTYYRSLISAKAKNVYDSIYKHYIKDKKYTVKKVNINFDKYVTGSSKSNLRSNLSNVIEKGYYAFYYDHPEIISLYRGYHYHWYISRSGNTYSAYSVTVTVTEPYSGASKQYGSFNKAVNTAYKKIKKNLPKKASREAKLYAIHNYICKKMTYSKKGNDRKQVAVPAFLSPHKGVCESYARSFKVLCDKFGIPCIQLSGNTYDSNGQGSHAWNYVQMTNKKWYLVDCTWDDQGKETLNTYFLKGTKSKGTDGKAIGSTRSPSKSIFTKYPKLNKSSYNGHLSCNMPKTKFTTLMWSGSSIICRWNKKTAKYGGSHITGYQIRYSTKKNMKNSKIKTIKGYNKSYAAFNIPKKYHWYMIRTYKKYKGFTIYGQWN